jgi:predicted RNA-binding Zn ribbon-like protein
MSASELHGDHPALDLLNTVMTVDGAKVERWTGGGDVLDWLRTLADEADALPARPPAGLLEAARALREQLRALVAARKDGAPVDVAALNALLARAPRRLVVHAQDGALRLGNAYEGKPTDALLAPVVEEAARLLTEEKQDLVKRCENPECTLWFLDKSKSHQRRWCSMGLCGNRHKVASFRKRKAAA